MQYELVEISLWFETSMAKAILYLNLLYCKVQVLETSIATKRAETSVFAPYRFYHLKEVQFVSVSTSNTKLGFSYHHVSFFLRAVCFFFTFMYNIKVLLIH